MTAPRILLIAFGISAGLVSSPRLTNAQTTGLEPRTWELRGLSGALVPTGDQRDALKRAELYAAQVAWLPRPSLAITGTFGWAPSRDLASANTPKLDVFAYDLGAEFRPATWFTGRAVRFSPILGVGAGARSYNYRNLDERATHNLAGYGSVGGELLVRRVGFRVELRDYVSGFKPLVSGGSADTRNDLVVMTALRLTRKNATTN